MAAGVPAAGPRGGLETIIASVAGIYDCVIVTDNEKDFAGLQFFHPLHEAD